MSTERTVRPAEGGIDMTMRPASQDMTMRPASQDITMRPASQDMTMRGVSNAVSGNGTVRGDGGIGHDDDVSDNSFVLKGVGYRNIQSLSNNSGEAQVFLVERDGEKYVLKIYYPSFDVNKKILQRVYNFDFEMIVYHLNGDFDKFRRIALQGAAALAYCHQSNIIHKDVKPSNFFFRDKEHTELVLGDFGISSMLDQDGKAHKTTQARTPIYAAPEMYTDVIDGVVEVTTAVDFYSLGISLMALWLGESPMSTNERVMMRQKNEGRLPHIQELPERVRMIVQGLTVVNPNSRWGYEEVEEWFKGGSPKVDLSSPFLKYKSFIVDPEKNLVADNIHELIPLLLDNEALAIGYLYNGRISQWLESCGNQKLSTIVKDIVVNRYPVDQHAGLLAAVYAMEPTYPYKDIKGNLCDDTHSVAISMLSYPKEYGMLLSNPNDSLFLYLESHTKCNIKRIRSYFSKQDEQSRKVAVMRTVYEIDPEIPLLTRYPSSSLKEIVHAYGKENLQEDDWHCLTDGRLLSWMYSHEDRMACESLRIMTQGQPYSETLAYKVLYNLDREAAYDLKSAFTPNQIGERLNERLKNVRTAVYRFCRILGVTPTYLLPEGLEVTDGRNLDMSNSTQLRSEIRNGALAQWMSVFYHENPDADFSEEYAYENTLVEWLAALGKIDPTQTYYKRFVEAREETLKRVKDVRDNWRKAKRRENFWRTTFYGLCGLWILLILLIGVKDRTYLLNHTFLSIGLPLGGVTAIIVGTRAFFRGYDFMLSCLWGLAGALSSFIPILILRYFDQSHPSMFNVAIVFMTLIYMLVCHLTDFRGDQKADSKLISEVLEDDIKSTLLEPLYYTFKTKAYKFNGSKFGLLNDVTDQVRSISGESVLHYVLWSVLAFVLVLEFVVFSPTLLNVSNPNSDNLKVSPTKLIKQIEKDVE